MKIGLMVVVTGKSGAGKDAVADEYLNNPAIQELHFQKVVTCTDRCARPSEKDGREYHFVSPEELKNMAKNRELVEPVTQYGLSNKATSRSEIARLFNGENLVWRIDSSRAAEVASGEFFKNQFPNKANVLQEHTIILFITAPDEVIDGRRRKRDLVKYNPKEYKIRDKHDETYLKALQDKAISILNLDGKLDEAVESAVRSTLEFVRKTSGVENSNSRR
jgi:guanylate kinase